MSLSVPLPFEQEKPQNHPQKVTPQELLDIRESEWRPRLESVSLVSESPFNPEQLDQAAHALGAIFTRRLDTHQSSRLYHWPACTAAITVGIATNRYASGTFWPALWKTARVSASRQDRDSWGSDFLRSLELLGVDTFPGMNNKYVDPILMHSGIPTYCLDDLFDLLLRRSALEPGLDAHRFHLWAISGRHRLNGLNIPAQRFLSTGGDYALETVERCMHLLALLQEDPSASTHEVGLPPRFHAPASTALNRARERGALPKHTLSLPGRPRTSRPRIRLDPFVHGIHLTLPSIEDSANLDVLWEITTDDNTHHVHDQRWGTAPAEQTVFTLPRPTRSVSVTPQGVGVREQLTLIDPADPLLLFDDSGALVSSDTSLPPGPVWALHPSSKPLELPEEIEELAHHDVPYGWQGWTLLRVHLARNAHIGLAGHPKHWVRGKERPHLETPGPIPGVTTQYGAPVHSERPTVVLPAPEGAAMSWQVEVRSAGEGRLLWHTRAESGERVRLFQTQEPVVGSFMVNVRGPLGRGISRQVTVAEGFRAQHSPNTRVLDPHGLVPAHTHLSAPENADTDPVHLSFTPDETTHPATFRSATSVLPVAVGPPHLRLLTTGGNTPQWRAEPLRLDHETLASHGDLLVQLPEDDTRPGPLHILHGHENVQQVYPGTAVGPGTHRYPLGQIVETAQTHRHLRIVLRHQGTLIPIALIRPRRLATGAELHDRVVHLQGFPGIEDVSAAVYEHGAPWRPPTVVPVPGDGRFTLPEHLAGTVRILLAMDDPWSISDWPRRPEPDDPNTLTCDVPGRPQGVDAQEEALCAAFDDGLDLATLPLTHDNAVRLWHVLGDHHLLTRSGTPIWKIEACAAALGHSPVTALIAHGSAGPSPDESARSLVSSGIVTVAAGSHVPVDQAAELWHRLPIAAALATSNLLPLIDLRAPAPEHVELLEQLEQRCGPIATTLLEGETDPARHAGRFDASSEQLALMSEEQITAIWQEAKVVPRALLDQDSRTQAALGLFTVRNRPELHRARSAAPDLTATVLFLAERLEQTYRRPVMALLKPRHTPGAAHWRNLPAASLALALAARLAARGVPAFASLVRSRLSAWEELARNAPDLVRIDIVLAELALAGAERTHLTKEQTR